MNLIKGVLRPGLDSPNRWLFNIFHYIVGYGAQALAYATLMIGIIDLFGLEEWTWYSFAGAIALWVVSLLGRVEKRICHFYKESDFSQP